MKAKKELPIREIPLIIQDGAILNPAKGMRLDEDTFQYIEQITEAVEKVGGVLTFLWHSNYIINPFCWNLYPWTLKYLREKDAWFGTVKGAGEYGMYERKDCDILSCYEQTLK